jgi:excisionase family DNA binding protein
MNTPDIKGQREQRSQERVLARLALPPVDVNSRYTVDEAVALLRSSRPTIYHMIAAKKLCVLRDGRRVYVPGSEIARLSQLPQISAA